MLGLALWVLLIWGVFKIRRVSLRFLETQKTKAAVCTKWEQIAPMDECFEEDDL